MTSKQSFDSLTIDLRSVTSKMSKILVYWFYGFQSVGLSNSVSHSSYNSANEVNNDAVASIN